MCLRFYIAGGRVKFNTKPAQMYNNQILPLKKANRHKTMNRGKRRTNEVGPTVTQLSFQSIGVRKEHSRASLS